MDKPVYMIGQISVKDFDAYLEEYGMPVGQLFADAGADVLVATQEANILEGDWPGNWTVVVRLPSEQAAFDLYNSEEYAPLKKARMERLTTSTTLGIFPGFPTAAQQ